MSRQIADVVLFYSKFSEASKPCVNIVVTMKLPIRMVPLDTEFERERAANGKIIQVRNVPSLVVSYTDGNVQMYVGSPKIIAWLESIFQKKPNSPPKADHSTVDNTLLSEESSEEKPPKSKKSKEKSKKKSKKSKKSSNEDIGLIEPIDLEFEDSNVPSRPPPPPTNGLLLGKNTKTSNNLMDMAKKMMADRDSTLGYKAD